MTTLYIGLGSNLGDSFQTLHDVVDQLSSQSFWELIQVSSFYTSKPLDNMPQPEYVNAVAEFSTALSAKDCLHELQLMENKFGRNRDGGRWSARTLDLDILLYGDEQISEANLTVPHAGMLDRDFVLIPLYEISPNIEIPGFGTISKAVRNCENRGLIKHNDQHC